MKTIITNTFLVIFALSITSGLVADQEVKLPVAKDITNQQVQKS